MVGDVILNAPQKEGRRKMKYMKSLLAFATVALLGSSAWAYTIETDGTTRKITMEVGEKITDIQGPHKGSPRWWSYSASATYDSATYASDLEKALQYVKPSFVKANADNPLLSDGDFDDPVLTFEAVAETTSAVSFYIYGATAEGTEIPASMPNRPFGGSTIWSANNLDPKQFTITVKPASKTRHDGAEQTVEADKSVTLPDDIKTAWTAKSQAAAVATVSASGDAGVQPVVSGVARGKTDIWVENATDRWVYPVTVWEKTIGSDSINVKPGADNASVTCTADLEDAWTASSADDTVATVSVSGSETSVKPTIHGVAVGQTTVTVQNRYATWTITVNVRDMTQAEIFAAILTDKTGNARVDTTTDDDALYLWYETVGSSSLEIPAGYGAKADILAVGGGSGGTGRNNYNGNGGNGGAVQETDKSKSFTAGDSLSITVGDGSNGGNGAASSQGNPSYVTLAGTDVIRATGGTAGTRPSSSSSNKEGTGASGSGRTGKSSKITGFTYGAGGASGSASSKQAAASNTGNGGDGAPNGTTTGYKGGSGIVVIKITALNELKDVTVETPPADVTAKSGMTLGTISLTGGKAVDANGVQVAGTFAFKDATYALTVADDGKSFDVVFTPTDTATYKTATCKVAVTVTVTAKGAITAAGGETSGSDDNPIYTFTSTTGTKTLTIPEGYQATAKVLVVGGGASGAIGKYNQYTTYSGNGGGGGKGSETDENLVAAEYTISIGAGGQGVQYSGSSNYAAGNNGNPSSFVGGDINIQKDGGTRGSSGSTSGGSAGTGGCNITSAIDGKTYGVDGPSASSGTASTTAGSGGKGSRRASSSGTQSSGAGQNGIVMVQITSFEALPKEGEMDMMISKNGTKAFTPDSYVITHGEKTGNGVASVTVVDNVATIKASGTAEQTGVVKLYDAKNRLIKTINVTVKDLQTKTWKGHTISYLNATVTGDDSSDLVVTFKNTTSDGILDIPENAIVDYLVVGGGGSGASPRSRSGSSYNYQGNGGGGAEAIYRTDAPFSSGAYSITVGAGGAAVNQSTGSTPTTGNPGKGSSLSNGSGLDVPASGGSAGAGGSNGSSSPGTGGSNLKCDIAEKGTDVTYGANGAAGSAGTKGQAGADGAASTGSGGAGGYHSKGGKGADGIVIVRIKGFVEKPLVKDAPTATVVYGQALKDAEFAGSMTNHLGTAVSGSFAWAETTDTTKKLTVAESGAEFDAVFTPDDKTYNKTVNVKATVIVGKKPVTVTADDKEKLVNNPTPALTYPQPTGLVGSDTITGELMWDGQETVGGHDIVQAGDWASANPNYDITFVKGTLTVKAGKVTVNGKGYDNVTDAFNDLLASKGSATFNDTGIVYDGMTFQRGATLTVADDESWTVTNNGGTSLIATKIPGKMNLTVDGTLELSGDIFVAPAGEDDTVVTVTNFMLDASITVGKESNGATDAMAYLSFNHFENENQAEYRITLTTNGVVRSLNATKLVIADVFAAAPTDYKITETAIEGGWEYTLAPISTFAITVEIDGTCVTNVTMDGESAVGTVRLPEGTTAVTLTLFADQTILTIPVYKVTTNGVTTVTAKTASYAVADGAVLSFTAEEAEFDDDATPEETKQAIKDAIDDGPAHDDAVAKVEKVTGDGADQVPAKELATWITESEVSSEDLAGSDYVAASANLGADGLIDEDDAEICCSDATVKASEDAANLVLTINLKPNEKADSEPITSEGVAKYIQVSDEMDSDFATIDPGRVTVDDDEVTIEPDSAKEKEFFKVVLVKDDGTTSKVESQVIAIATRTTTGVAAGKKVREAVSVTWTDVDGSDIPLQKVVSTDAVTEGDLLYAWNAATEVYDCWKLSGTKVWEPQTTVRMSGEEVTENKPSTDRTFALGEVIWLERQDTSKPVHLYGGVDEDAELPEINEGMNLLSAPNFEAIDLDGKYPEGVAVEGDEVTLPIPDKSPKTFTFKDGAWGYQGFIKMGDKGIRPGRVTATPDEKMLIPAGHGFWYKRQAKAE